MMAKAGMLFQQTVKGLIITIVNEVTIFFCNNSVLKYYSYFVILYKSNVDFLNKVL